MKRSSVMALGLLAALCVYLGCARPAPKPAEPAPKAEKAEEKAAEKPARKQVRLSIGGNGVGGVYYVYAGALSEIINKSVEGVQSTVEVCPGSSLEHVRRMHAGDLQMGPAMDDVVHQAVTGTGKFTEKQKVATMFSMYPAVMQGVTLAKYPIRTPQDLRGKRVSAGTPGTGSYVMFEAVMGALGIPLSEMKIQHLMWQEGVEAIRNGNLDVQFATLGYPTQFIMDLASTHEIALISFSEDDLKKICEKFAYYAPSKVPGGTYKGVKDDVPAPGIWNSFLAADDVPEDVVYGVVKAVFENRATLEKAYSGAKDTTPENTLKYAVAPLHPGALRYYKEKGYTIPERLLPKR